MKKIIPHVFVLLAFILLVFLGTWQVERRAYKQDLISKVDARVNLPPISIDQYTNAENDEFKKMTVKGRFLHEKEILLLNKPYNGKQGQHVLTPIQLSNGRTILVDRGWIPSDKDPSKFNEEVEVTGVIRKTQKLNSIGKMITLDNEPERNIWFTVDLPAIYQSMGLPQEEIYLDMINENKSKAYPMALPAEIHIYNEHLQYILTWYGLAVGLLLVYYFRFFHKKKK